MAELPAAWHPVTLRQLLGHTSGVPDFTENLDFRDAFIESPEVPLPPEEMLAFVEDEPLHFTPGTQYRYSNSDNIIVGLTRPISTASSAATFAARCSDAHSGASSVGGSRSPTPSRRAPV